MQLDDLERIWARQETLVARSLAIDERLLRELVLGKVRRRLAPYVVGRSVEVVLGLGFLAAIVPVLLAHWGEARYVLVGGALAAFAAGLTVSSARLLVGVLSLDHGGTVTAIQTELESLQLAHYRSFEWALLGGILLWLPAMLVPFEALTGVDALARVELPYLVANLALGAAVLATGRVLSRRYVDRAPPGSRGRRFAEAVSGRALAASRERLAELARFETAG